MTAGRPLATLIVLALGLAQGACSPFSGFVADHWPHWAGGLPNDAPPRPGAPGYEEFIAHKQPDSTGSTAGGNVQPLGASPQPANAAAVGQPVNTAVAPRAVNSKTTPAPEDRSATAGGLY